VRYLEHHGHETLAFLDIGATAVVVDEMAGRPASASGVQNGLRRLMSRFAGRGGGFDDGASGATDSRSGRQEDPRGLGDGGRHHRRPADLAVRLAPYPALRHGEPLAVRVRMEALHFFDDAGKRIDVGWR
jgi:multiple sugar transport system ATP-binding protein